MRGPYGARIGRISAAAGRAIGRFCSDKRANVAVMAALTAPMIIGGAALGFETAYWGQLNRGMQNAADAASIAAATNDGSNYGIEAKAVTAQYGYTNGTANVTVTASNAAACPGGGSTCYSVTISKVVPLYLAQVIGYSGNTTLNGSRAVTISATATAVRGTVPREYCILALSTTGTPLTTNGTQGGSERLQHDVQRIGQLQWS